MELREDSAERNAASCPRERRYQVVRVNGLVSQVPWMHPAEKRVRICLPAGARAKSRQENGDREPTYFAHGYPRSPRSCGRVIDVLLEAAKNSNRHHCV